jgi:hypothetical protein
MTTAYTDAESLEAYVGTTYTLPVAAEVTRLIERASQLIDFVTRGRAQAGYDGDLSIGPTNTLPLGALTQEDYQTALERAANAQVEFYLEVGEEHEIVGLTGSARTGRVSFDKLPSRLGPRAKDALIEAGLISARVWIR